MIKRKVCVVVNSRANYGRIKTVLKAVQAQDNYLSGAFILLFSIVAVIGTLVSDILLAWADPRIRFQSQN